MKNEPTQAPSDYCSSHDNLHCVHLSVWSQSLAKRAFDVAAVLVSFPILLPLLAVIALAVLLTSGVPVVFRQERVGRHRTPFVIRKFRTMRLSGQPDGIAISVSSSHRITALGSFLRRSKLDELPQVLNVLSGSMSLVGPRPKVPEQQSDALLCRPGITGAATLAFAQEESQFMQLPVEALEHHFRHAILPAKQRIDADYMGRATFLSDMRLIVDTVLGRWQMYSVQVDFVPSHDHSQALSPEAPSVFT